MTESIQFIQLMNDIVQCRLCETELPLGVNPVLQAHTNAKILIAGQAPGIKVHETGIPFNDPSGDRLRDWLGVTKEQFYDGNIFAIIPMGFCYPGKGKSGDLPPKPICADTWRRRILAQLPNIKLTLVIGQYAQKWHLNTTQGVTDTVKNWQQWAPDIIPLPHPSPRNNIWLKKNAWFEDDVVPCLSSLVRNIV